VKPLRAGTVEIVKVSEIDRGRVDPHKLYSNLPHALVARYRDELGPSLMAAETGDLILSYHSYLLRTSALTILVDTCIGNGKDRHSMPEWHRLDTPYLARLARFGVRPKDVDVVLCTHLHADHVGWNTRAVDGQWVPTFPNARYLIAETEYAHYAAQYAASGAAVNRGSFADSVLPVVERGLAQFVDASHGVTVDPDGRIALEPAPGHTPGNIMVVVSGGGREALLCGDVIHHPIQLALPWLRLLADHDPQLADATRRALLERCADTETTLLTGHFPEPTAGVVRRAGAAYAFEFTG
jgi:glyoxylase-like metal-dependent hydrolase (beta-lactamase superfamily II)